MSEESRRTSTLLALVLVLASALGGLGWLWLKAAHHPEISFLPHRAPAEWIVYPCPPDVMPHSAVGLSTVFKRSFRLARVPSHAPLRVAAFHSYELTVNGITPHIRLRRAGNWKQPDLFDVTTELRAGQNEIAVTVSNSNGPPALWLALEPDRPNLTATDPLHPNPAAIASDESWQASFAGAAWQSARLAAKPKTILRGGPLDGGEAPSAGLRARWPTLTVFVALSLVGCVLFTNWGPTFAASPVWARICHRWPPVREHWPLIGVGLLWLALFANNLGLLPPEVGFDAQGHTSYIRFIQEHHSLPRADQGWETFQPPLYYILCAALLEVFDLDLSQTGGVLALRVLGLGLSLAHLVLVWASLRLLFPNDSRKQRFGLMLAACLAPMLYLSHFITNEAPAALMASACVYLTLRILKQDRPSWKLWTVLGLTLGAALLTKLTALLLLPAVFGALAWKAATIVTSRFGSGAPGETPPTRTTDGPAWVGGAALAFAICLLVCGWHYGRVWADLGTPFVAGWELRPSCPFWQDDGYRTREFYLRFGSSLGYPWFSNMRSFADGIYSTLWGDGLLGGGNSFLSRAPWNNDLMSLGYWLALAPSIGILVGTVLMLVNFLRRPDPERFLLLSLSFLVALALAFISLEGPSCSTAKAFHGLSALTPLCAFGACGLSALSTRRLRLPLCILVGVWAINSYSSFWSSRASLPTMLARTRLLLEEKRYPEAIATLRTRLAADSQSPGARSLLAAALGAAGNPEEALAEAQTALRERPDDALGHLALAAAFSSRQQFEPATLHARRAVELAPGHAPAYITLAALLNHEGHVEDTIIIARQGLAVSPSNAQLHILLGNALLARGETAEGNLQLELAAALNGQ